MTPPLTPAGQALVLAASYAEEAQPGITATATRDVLAIERQAADRALAELRREVEGHEAIGALSKAHVLALIDKASKPEEGA